MYLIKESFQYIDYNDFKSEIENSEINKLTFKKLAPMPKELQKAFYDDGVGKTSFIVEGLLKNVSKFFTEKMKKPAYASLTYNNKSKVKPKYDLFVYTEGKESYYGVSFKWGIFILYTIDDISDSNFNKIVKEYTTKFGDWMYLIKESKQTALISKILSHEESLVKASGKITFKDSLQIQVKELFFTANNKNKYELNDIGKKFGVKSHPSGATFVYYFDYNKLSSFKTFLKSNDYSIQEVEDDTVEYIRDSIDGLVSHYNRTKDKNDRDWFLKNLKMLYELNNISDKDIEEFNFMDYK